MRNSFFKCHTKDGHVQVENVCGMIWLEFMIDINGNNISMYVFIMQTLKGGNVHLVITDCFCYHYHH